MRSVYTAALGLVLGAVLGAPLGAQERGTPPLLESTYEGILLTEAQKAKFQELAAQYQREREEITAALFAPMDSSAKESAVIAVDSALGRLKQRHDSLHRGVLTSAQQQVLDRQVRAWRAFRLGNDRAIILMGVGITDAQVAATEKLLTEEWTKIRAFHQAQGYNEVTNRFATPEGEVRARKLRYELLAQNIPAIYALLTPEQQKLSASNYERLKAHFDRDARCTDAPGSAECQPQVP
jgi:hypothetical protein